MGNDGATVKASGTFRLGVLEVHRLGYGAMQLTGPGVWGPPADRHLALAVLRRAVDLGVDLVDTADSYGPYVAEELIRQALHPYRGVAVATKAGLVRTGPGVWHPVGRPEYLRQECEMSLRRLGLEQIPLFQLHRIDPAVALEDQVGELRRLQEEGKVRLVGLSEVGPEQLRAARAVCPIASVQNRYSVTDRSWDAMVDACEREKIAFIPWFPVAAGNLAHREGAVAALAGRLGVTPVQLALAWLLHRSAVILPIPGTSSLAHLEENVEAALIGLTEEQYAQLSKLS